MSFIFRITEPLLPIDRSAFLAALAAALRHEAQPVGDGVVYRVARDLLRAGYWRPPAVVASGPRYNRNKLNADAPIAE